MTSRSVPAWTTAVLSLLAPAVADAECVRRPARVVLAVPSNELVFSGKAVEMVRTADVGYRVTFEVDRVWKGPVPERIDLYVWELAPEIPRFTLDAQHIVIATRLTDPRARAGAGLGDSEATAFTPSACSDPETLGPDFRRDLGRGHPPKGRGNTPEREGGPH